MKQQQEQNQEDSAVPTRKAHVFRQNLLPRLRDSSYGWLHFVALAYAYGANMTGLGGMFLYTHRSFDGSTIAFLSMLLSILLSFHGKIVGTYLVHEAAHGTIFERSPLSNEWFGRLALYAAGCPYVDFRHVRKMHMAHHKDRADVVSFDYRAFVKKLPSILQNLTLLCEFMLIPVIEIIHHVRAAIYPILHASTMPPHRVWSASLGGSLYMLYWIVLWRYGIVWPCVVTGMLVLHFLVLNDCFHHTFEAVTTGNCVPGPGDRTAAYEEENTFSNLLSIQHRAWNIINLNFGYHNVHHQKPMTPWYSLPKLHNDIYDQSKDSTNFQVLTIPEVLYAWHRHRLRRVTEEDYGVVYPIGTPGRANDFIGALGVSFLTV